MSERASGSQNRSSINFREAANVGYRPFTNETGLAAPYVRRRVKALTEAARKSVGGLAERLAEGGVDRESLANFASVVEARAARLADTV